MQEKIEVPVDEDARGERSFSLLKRLPDDVHQIIAPFLPSNDLLKFFCTSKTMFSGYPKAINKRLLSHVVKGEEEIVLKMIRANPNLLLTTSTTTDNSGRPYEAVTPFQAALLCHDVTLWKKIEPYFEMLPNGQEEKVEQFKKAFPEGFPEEQELYDFTSLIQAISESSDADIQAALRKENNETAICQILKDFRQTFTDLAKKETFFNPSHLMKAFSLYDEKFKTWSWNQRDLFWRQVIGYTQRFLPASYAQAFCQGLYYIVEEKEPPDRSLNFQFDSGSYYPLAQDSGLGFDFGISDEGDAGGARGKSGRGARPRRCAVSLINYVVEQQQSYLDLSTTCEATVNRKRLINPIFLRYNQLGYASHITY